MKQDKTFKLWHEEQQPNFMAEKGKRIREIQRWRYRDRTSLTVQWLRRRVFTAGGTGSIRDWGNKFFCAVKVFFFLKGVFWVSSSICFWFWQSPRVEAKSRHGGATAAAQELCLCWGGQDCWRVGEWEDLTWKPCRGGSGLWALGRDQWAPGPGAWMGWTRWPVWA